MCFFYQSIERLALLGRDVCHKRPEIIVQNMRRIGEFIIFLLLRCGARVIIITIIKTVVDIQRASPDRGRYANNIVGQLHCADLVPASI